VATQSFQRSRLQSRLRDRQGQQQVNIKQPAPQTLVSKECQTSTRRRMARRRRSSHAVLSCRVPSPRPCIYPTTHILCRRVNTKITLFDSLVSVSFVGFREHLLYCFSFSSSFLYNCFSLSPSVPSKRIALCPSLQAQSTLILSIYWTFASLNYQFSSLSQVIVGMVDHIAICANKTSLQL
jgi:hypothetical protein